MTNVGNADQKPIRTLQNIIHKFPSPSKLKKPAFALVKSAPFRVALVKSVSCISASINFVGSQLIDEQVISLLLKIPDFFIFFCNNSSY